MVMGLTLLVTLSILLSLATKIGPVVSAMEEDWVVRMVVNVLTTDEGLAVNKGMAEEEVGGEVASVDGGK